LPPSKEKKVEKNLRSLTFYLNEAGLFYFGAPTVLRLKMTPILLITIALILMNPFWVHSHASAEDCFSKFGVSAKTVLRKLHEKKELTLVDVRDGKEFERFRIPGSVNIPLFAIKTKTFLKGRSLVLMNEGHSHKQLEGECEVLAKSGFTVSILNGGLYQWKQKGGPLEGDVFAQRELNKISPQTFFVEQAHGNWLLVDISQSEKAGGHPKNVHRIHILYTNHPEGFISELKAAVRNPAGRDCLFIICDEDGRKYEGIEKRVQEAGLTNVLYLKGGFAGYKVFEQQQSSSRQAGNDAGKRKTVKTNKGCKSCP
jgi:rhodanese-related sulfurtransferase